MKKLSLMNFLNKSKNTLVLTLILGCGPAMAQFTSTDSLRKKFDRYRVNHLSEKIYGHLDQNLYLTGEMLWFKLYTVDASLHKPTGISKVAYVEILNADNHPVLQTKISLHDGFGNGSLFLPASIAAGNYTFRAYTQWMRNFGPDFFFHKSITIINTFRKLDVTENKLKTKPDAQFFPEGGGLVYGLKSKVAFRVIDSSGKGIEFSGTVLDEAQDTIITIRPLKFGMGSFDLTPLPGHRYHVMIEDGNGQRNTYKLPDIREDGYVIRVSDSTESLISIAVHSKGTNTNGPVYLFVHTRNMVSTAATYFLQQGHATITIPKADLKEGISHITLFDAAFQPVCERLYYRPVKNHLLIDAQPNQREFGIRRKVSVDITTADEKQLPQSANLSVSVYRIDSLQQESDVDIRNYFWLSADLQGVIESPSYYLNTGAEVDEAVDHVMMTHGWRRFIWHDVLSTAPATLNYVPEYRGHIVLGRVTTLQGEPAAAIRTYLTSPSKNIQLYASISNDAGRVQYEMKDFRGPRKIIVQTNPLKDSIYQLQIYSPFADTFSIWRVKPFSLSENMKNELRARSIALQVQDVFYKERTNHFKTTTEDSTAFYGKADATYLLDDYTRFPVMEEVMREYVPSVMVRKRKGSFRFMTLDNVNKGVFDEDPMILLDGIPLFDVDKIMAFDPLLVKKLEVINRRYYMGALSLPGIVSYTTYTGDLAGFQLDPRSITLDYEGLQLQREFYVPKYETSKQRESRLPDQRNLLFWAPEVICGSDGKQHLEFFTSDLAGTYNMVIEGITADGLTGRTTISFSVRHFDN